MINVSDRNCWNQSEKVLQGQCLLVLVSKTFIVPDHISEVIVCIVALLLHQLHRVVEHLYRFHRLTANNKLFCKRLEVELL